MKRPSRFMPRVVKKTVTWRGWVAVAALIGIFGSILIWCFWKGPILSLGVVAFMVVGTIISTKRVRAKLRRLAAERPNESICTFARSVDCRQVDTWIVRAAYEQLQEYLVADYPNFPLRPTDNIEKDLHIDDDGLSSDIAETIAERAQRDYKDAASNPYYGKVKTVGDLVKFFKHQPELVSKT